MIKDTWFSELTEKYENMSKLSVINRNTTIPVSPILSTRSRAAASVMPNLTIDSHEG